MLFAPVVESNFSMFEQRWRRACDSKQPERGSERYEGPICGFTAGGFICAGAEIRQFDL